jgi:hypothetical protein
MQDEAETTMFGLIVTASILLAGSLLVAYGTVARNRWGINLKPVNCPCCHAAVPQVRKPKSLREALWGGGTCDKCGCQMDKWGRHIATLKP